ncbi:MAG TPA: aquaporin [Candidatus Nitrosotalea sp.]|nr:aquaporin [Candidatus Nitrosotalea sp.]
MAARKTRATKQSLLLKIGVELVATLFVTLVATVVDVLYYTRTGDVDFVSRWLARGFITAAMIYAFSGISGAHLSPAVSLGFMLRRAMPAAQMLLYWAAQIAGGFLAALLAFAVWGHAVALGASHPGPQFTQVQAAIAEAICTFLLMIVILATAGEEAAVGRQAAVAVGFTVAACGFFAGPISGASMNPARSIPPQILGGAYDLIWIYAIGPCVGAALAACAVALVAPRPAEGERKAGSGA